MKIFELADIFYTKSNIKKFKAFKSLAIYYLNVYNMIIENKIIVLEKYDRLRKQPF